MKQKQANGKPHFSKIKFNRHKTTFFKMFILFSFERKGEERERETSKDRFERH